GSMSSPPPPAHERVRPVPRVAASLVRGAGPADLAIVFGTAIQSLNYYARRETSTAKTPVEVTALVPPGRRAFVLASEDALEDLRANAPGLRLTEVDRAPYFKFQFSA